MPLYDFIKNLLGMPSYRPDDFHRNRPPNEDNYRDQYRDPNYENTWRDAEEGSDEPPMQFNVFSDPIEMHRYFEQQMNEIMKNFGGLFDNSTFFGGFEEIGPPQNSDMFTQTEGERKGNLRDQLLKPGYTNTKDDLKPGALKSDSDVDGKVDLQDLHDMLKEKPSKQEITPYQGHSRLFSPQFRISGSSMSSKTIRKADGSIETQNTIKNSDGSEETTIIKQLGDQQYKMTVRTDKDGRKERIEDMVNIDEKDVPIFKNSFQNDSQPNLNKWFPFDKFFK